jgi:CheY-like chemotaxis protein
VVPGMPERPIEVLIVEDSQADVYLTKVALRDATIANQIHVVEDGEEALALLKHEGAYVDAPQPDCVAGSGPAGEGWI